MFKTIVSRPWLYWSVQAALVFAIPALLGALVAGEGATPTPPMLGCAVVYIASASWLVFDLARQRAEYLRWLARESRGLRMRDAQ